jgi:hypothetical protein
MRANYLDRCRKKSLKSWSDILLYRGVSCSWSAISQLGRGCDQSSATSYWPKDITAAVKGTCERLLLIKYIMRCAYLSLIRNLECYTQKIPLLPLTTLLSMFYNENLFWNNSFRWKSLHYLERNVKKWLNILLNFRCFTTNVLPMSDLFCKS